MLVSAAMLNLIRCCEYSLGRTLLAQNGSNEPDEIRGKKKHPVKITVFFDHGQDMTRSKKVRHQNSALTTVRERV